MSRSGRETLLDVREWSKNPHGSQGVVWRPSRMSGSGRKAYRMSGIGQKAIPNVWELSKTLLDVREQ